MISKNQIKFVKSLQQKKIQTHPFCKTFMVSIMMFQRRNDRSSFALMPLSFQVWIWLKQHFDWHSPLHSSLHLQWWLILYKQSIYHKLWVITPYIVTWELWKECNHRIFQGKNKRTFQHYFKLKIPLYLLKQLQMKKLVLLVMAKELQPSQ